MRMKKRVAMAMAMATIGTDNNQLKAVTAMSNGGGDGNSDDDGGRRRRHDNGGGGGVTHEAAGGDAPLSFRPHQFDVARTKLNGRQQRPIDQVGALGLGTTLPWRWYQRAAASGPWCEPITSHGPVLGVVLLSRHFGERT